MYKTLIILLSSLLLFGCSYFHVYQPDIQQGNVITPNMTHKLRLGMTATEVKRILGNPVLKNTFAAHRLDYVYTYMSGQTGKTTEKRLILSFRNGKLVNKKLD